MEFTITTFEDWRKVFQLHLEKETIWSGIRRSALWDWCIAREGCYVPRGNLLYKFKELERLLYALWKPPSQEMIQIYTNIGCWRLKIKEYL